MIVSMYRFKQLSAEPSPGSSSDRLYRWRCSDTNDMQQGHRNTEENSEVDKGPSFHRTWWRAHGHEVATLSVSIYETCIH